MINKRGTYFFGGIYGVGKSTLCNELSKILNIPHYSASDLISNVNNENYGSNKVVKDKDLNQKILTSAVNIILDKTNPIILSGHFCIFDKINHVEVIPESVFNEISISKIILLDAENDRIVQHLLARDKKNYSSDEILSIQNKEKSQAELISKKINVPLYCHKMSFTDDDIPKIIDFLQQEYIYENGST